MQTEKPKQSYYAIIPANVRYDKNLTPNAKLLYGEITALCNEKGYCWAENKYFADLYGVSLKSISVWINSLVDNGYIQSEIIYKENSKEIYARQLTIAIPPYGRNLPYPQKKSSIPMEENFKDNNTNEYIYNKEERKADSETETPYAGKPYAGNPNMVKQGIEKQGVENQGLEFQGVENQGQLNTNIQNTNKKERKADSFDAILDKYIEENIPLNDRQTIRDLLGEWLKVRKAKRAAMTNRAITLNLNRLKGLASESRMSIAQYLEEVIIRGWQAFFVIRDWNSACSAGRKSNEATSGALEHHYTSEQLRSYFSDLHDFDNLCDRWDL